MCVGATLCRICACKRCVLLIMSAEYDQIALQISKMAANSLKHDQTAPQGAV